jgi:hypothetical protein
MIWLLTQLSEIEESHGAYIIKPMSEMLLLESMRHICIHGRLGLQQRVGINVSILLVRVMILVLCSLACIGSASQCTPKALLRAARKIVDY